MKTAHLLILWVCVLTLLVREPVTYSQIFAERTITLTEELTLFEKHLLPKKKGFIQYE